MVERRAARSKISEFSWQEKENHTKQIPGGHTLTVTLLKEGSEIGVILAASPGRKSPVSVTVEQGSSVLFISYNRLIYNCTQNPPLPQTASQKLHVDCGRKRAGAS
ncbi:MAG: hypothetical protein ACLTBV_14905 [Enterocloster bolteae]